MGSRMRSLSLRRMNESLLNDNQRGKENRLMPMELKTRLIEKKIRTPEKVLKRLVVILYQCLFYV